jgi:hypothetical protein
MKMKKIGILFVAVSLFAAGLYAVTQTFDGAGSPPYVSQQGALMFPNSALSYGINPGDQAGNAYPAYASCAITKGQIVILDGGTTYPVSVSKTASAGVITALGIAMNTVTAAGEVVYVRTRGVIRATTAVAVTKGDILITSATAGSLTLAAGVVTVANYTALSQTAFVATAAETTTGAGSALVIVHGR